MLTELQVHYDQLEEARLALIRVIRELDPRILHHKSSPERWSVLEDLQHLVLAEQRTSLEFGSIRASDKPNPQNLAMVLDVLDQDVIVDVPDPGMLPDGRGAVEDLIRDWEQARRELRGFLETVGDENLDTPVSSHPITGPLSVVDSLRLLAAHFHHHRRRIEAATDPT